MATEFTPAPAPGWWQVRLDRDDHTVAIPAGVHVDLGATAKALAADRSAVALPRALGCGVLVNLGGDVAVAGTAPTGGWAVGIAPRCTTPLDSVDQVVAVHAGGLATSGTTARAWVRNGRVVHHIIDPWTGEPARPVWSLVSTTAPSCVEANAWSTAAVVWGDDAVGSAHRRRRAGQARGHRRWDHLRRWLAAGHCRPPRPIRSAPSSGRRSDARHLLDDPLVHHAGHRHRLAGPVDPGPCPRDPDCRAGESRSWPAFAQADLHKRVSLLAMVFLAIHVLTAVLDTYVHLGWASIVVPFSSSYEPLWTGLGTVALDLMLAVAVSSALRQRISARTWRGIHWLAYGSWPLAMAHALGEGTDGFKLWMDVLAGLCTVAVGAALGWRIVEHRASRERARRVGARTRAVPDGPRLPPAARDGQPPAPDPDGSPAPPTS